MIWFLKQLYYDLSFALELPLAIIRALRQSLFRKAGFIEPVYDRILPKSSSRQRVIRGGEIKLEHLNKRFPHSRFHSQCIYFVSSALPKDYLYRLKRAQFYRKLIVWNQNGVAFPAWAPNSYQAINRRLRYGLERADVVIFQSRFCMESCYKWLGKVKGQSAIIYNPVDTTKFIPSGRGNRSFTLLLCGTQQAKYRVTSAIDVLKKLIAKRHNCKLIIAGRLNWRNSEVEIGQYIAQCGLAEHIQLLGEFTRKEAAKIYHLGDILLHTKYNDPCPTSVLEALSCGLPVVGSMSGGLPELVSEESGVLVTVPRDDYYTDHIVPSESGSYAVEMIISNYKSYSLAARQSAVERFDLKYWLEKHEQIFMGRTLESYFS